MQNIFTRYFDENHSLLNNFLERMKGKYLQEERKRAGEGNKDRCLKRNHFDLSQNRLF